MSQQLSVTGVPSAMDKLLSQIPVTSLMRHDSKRDFSGRAEVVTVLTTDTVMDVMKVLFKFHIASVPVVSAEQAEEKAETKSAVFDFWVQQSGTRKPGVVLGFVDMLDILTYIVSALPSQRVEKEGMDMEPLEIAGRSLLESPIANVINFSRKDKIVPIAQDHTVREALQFFAKGTHHLLLFDDLKSVSGLVSQSDFIRLLNSHFAKGELHQSCNFNFDKKFREIAPSVSILPTDTVFQAISKLGSGLRTLAVIDANGLLVGNFSAADVGYAFAIGRREVEELEKDEVFRMIFGHLHLTVQDYLTKFHPRSLAPKLCLPAVSLEEVCKVMVDTGIKQLWVTDDLATKVPIGVITQTDICRLIEECMSCQSCTAARG